MAIPAAQLAKLALVAFVYLKSMRKPKYASAKLSKRTYKSNKSTVAVQQSNARYPVPLLVLLSHLSKASKLSIPRLLRSPHPK